MPKPPRDLSVQTSLKELLELEESRIQKEAAETEARTRAAEASREEARRASEIAEAKRRADDDARSRDAALRAREEDARVEAIRLAIVERERALTEARLRREGEERAHLARAYDEARATNPRQSRSRAPLVAALLSAVFAFAGSGGAYAGLVAPKVSQLEGERARLESENKQLASELEARKRDDMTQQERLEHAKREMGKLEERILVLQNEMKTLAARRRAGASSFGPSAPAGTKKSEKCLYESDPLCFQIGK